MTLLQILGLVYVIGVVYNLMAILIGVPANVLPKVKKPLSNLDLFFVVMATIIYCALWPVAGMFLLLVNLFT